jgi:hypothetical protein
VAPVPTHPSSKCEQGVRTETQGRETHLRYEFLFSSPGY